MIFYTNTQKELYVGDCASGDREATQAEITAWEASRAPKPIDQIRAIEAQPAVADAFIRATRQLVLGTWFAKVKAMPGAAGLTRDQIEAYCRANDPSYKTLAEAEDAIKPLRGQP